MKVKELITALQALTPAQQEQQVLVEGYESGYADLHVRTDTKVVVHKCPAWYDGPYQDPDFILEELGSCPPFPVVVLTRG
jgi:hypothetical protein